MEEEYRARKRKRDIMNFIRDEAKEYACYCGYTGMKPKKVYFTNRLWTNVDLCCEKCPEERSVSMNYPDELINFD